MMQALIISFPAASALAMQYTYKQAGSRCLALPHTVYVNALCATPDPISVWDKQSILYGWHAASRLRIVGDSTQAAYNTVRPAAVFSGPATESSYF